MKTLDFYNKEIDAKKKIMTQAVNTVGMTNNSEDILLAIKAIESLENVDQYPEFAVAVEAIVDKILAMDLTSSSGQDLTLLSRALKLKDIPIGSEERWQQLTQDDKNVDMKGDIVVGERTLESFDDKVLEEYYIGQIFSNSSTLSYI